MTPQAALQQMHAQADPARAADMARYHKASRAYLGLPNPALDAMVKDWRAAVDLDDRLALAAELWDSDIHEARIAAAKLLTQARIRPDDSAAWALVASWIPQCDGWAIADHACIAGQKRLVADPARLDQIESWTTSDHLWTKRAALVITLPWTKQNHPKPDDLARRDRCLGWAAVYATDHSWFIQKAIGWWLRELSKHDPDRVQAFLAAHGDRMKLFAVKEALRRMPAA